MSQHIAIVTTSYPAHDDDAAGHFVAAEAVEHSIVGHRVHVVCPGVGSLGDEFGVREDSEERPPYPTIHRVGGGQAFGWPGAAARLRQAPWRLGSAAVFVRRAERRLRLLEDAGLDRIEAHWMVPCVVPIALTTRCPLWVTCHGGDVRLLVAAPAVFREAIVRQVLKRARRITFVAHALRAELLAVLPADLARQVDGIAAVRPALLTVTLPAGPKPARTADRLEIAVVGRLVSGKRIELAIRGTSQVERPCRLTLIGDGPARDGLLQLATRLGVPIRMLGQLSRTETHRVMRDQDAIVHTSAAEGAPSVVREARVLGIPVIATASGDIERWAKADHGITIAKPHAESIARAITAIADRVIHKPASQVPAQGALKSPHRS